MTTRARVCSPKPKPKRPDAQHNMRTATTNNIISLSLSLALTDVHAKHMHIVCQTAAATSDQRRQHRCSVASARTDARARACAQCSRSSCERVARRVLTKWCGSLWVSGRVCVRDPRHAILYRRVCMCVCVCIRIMHVCQLSWRKIYMLKYVHDAHRDVCRTKPKRAYVRLVMMCLCVCVCCGVGAARPGRSDCGRRW